MVHLYQSLIKTLKFGYKPKIIEDSLGNSVSNIGLIYKSILLGNIIFNLIGRNKQFPLAIMLPNTVPTAIVFFAIQYLNIVSAILNFTSGSKNIISCIKKSNVKYVITSKKFIEQNNMLNLINTMNEQDCKFIYLEDLKELINIKYKVLALIDLLSRILISKKNFCKDLAVILYTSGTESDPKGVGLSHENLYANRMQVLKTLNIDKKEKFFTCLPFFHSFGLGIGVLLPVLSGCKVYLYPTPLHFQTIPKLIEETKSTVFFSTDTFLKKYIPFVKKTTFKNLNYLIAGAEKVDNITHEKYLQFGIKILEGYGVTEASPAVSVNTNENYKLGSVGKFVPEILYKVEKVDGCKDGGLLYIKGKNVIKNYLGKSETFDWYNTGDIVNIDEEGYLYILGRLKRFAKIAGEMISLSQIEEFAKNIWPENNSVVCSIKDSSKGEALILLTDKKDANLDIISKSMKEAGFSTLYIPKTLKTIDELPILGSGKLDYRRIQDIAEI